MPKNNNQDKSQAKIATKFEDIKSDFITIASHQLRTPIAGIRWSLDSVLSGKAGVLSDKQREILGEAYQNNKFLVKVVNDLLRAARLEERGANLEPEFISLISIVKDLIKKNADFTKASNCQITFQVENGLPKIYFDPLQARQVISSLIDNSIRYGGHKGVVAISLKRQGNYVLLKIKDNGIGIPVKEQEKVFTRFFRASNAIKTQTEGLGLDLYVDKKIIEASGGKINFNSVQNKGTIFNVLFPIKKQERTVAPVDNEASGGDSDTDDLLKKEREFVSITVHELKAPLGATKWSLEMLKSGRSGSLTSDQLELIEQIYRGNERLLVLVRDLLDLAKLQEGKFDVNPQPLNLKQIIDDVVAAFMAEAKRKKLKIDLPKISGGLPIVMGDANRIAQVLTNLVSNAVKYTLENGSVQINIEKKASQDMKLMAQNFSLLDIANTDDKKGYLVISVKDTGVGISTEEQKKLFTRFFRGKNVLKSKAEGTGLGLYITKTIVNLHHGDIWFISEPGKGSTFYFSLPIA